jgi:small subunit ribosomal protein S16
MLKIRLRRMGKTHAPFYRVVVSDSRRTPTAASVEEVGHYNPRPTPPDLRLDLERLRYWQGQGALLSPTVKKLVQRLESGKLETAAAKPKTAAKAAKAEAAPPAEKPAEATAAPAAEQPAEAAPAEEPAAEETVQAAATAAEPAAAETAQAAEPAAEPAPEAKAEAAEEKPAKKVAAEAAEAQADEPKPAEAAEAQAADAPADEAEPAAAEAPETGDSEEKADA